MLASDALTPLASPLAAVWWSAFSDFLVDIEADLAPYTVVSYRKEMTQLIRWCIAEGIPMTEREGPDGAAFRVLHLKKYFRKRRQEDGVSEATCLYEARIANRFFKVCVQEGYRTTNPLKDMVFRKPPKPYVYCPDTEDLQRFLTALKERWNPKTNAKIKFVKPAERDFFLSRDYALFTGLMETGMRPCEMLALTMEDYQPDRLLCAIRKAKDREPRQVQFSPLWREAVEKWLKKRPRRSPSDRLFVSVYGEPLTVLGVSQSFRTYRDRAGLPKALHLYGLRHYALTSMAAVDLLMAARQAGHNDLKTTRGYVHRAEEVDRKKFEAAATLGNILAHKKTIAKRKLV